jgi:hypothetical protein
LFRVCGFFVLLFKVFPGVCHYRSAINQMTEGHLYILDTFLGQSPTVNMFPQFGWQIDPFGHSASTPIMFALMGFSATVTYRISEAVLVERMERHALEFEWVICNLSVDWLYSDCESNRCLRHHTMLVYVMRPLYLPINLGKFDLVFLIYLIITKVWGVFIVWFFTCFPDLCLKPVTWDLQSLQ